MQEFKLIITNLEALVSTKPANAEQKEWMDDITDYINENGCGELYGHEYEGRIDIQRHHVLGRSAKQNKVPVGHWFVIPVPFELHDPNEKHKHHVGHCKKAFVRRFGAQKEIFSIMYHAMFESGYSVPDITIYNAIMSTSA